MFLIQGNYELSGIGTRDDCNVPETARAGGLYKKEYAPSHGVGLADALLAATAAAENAELITLNVKHYPMIEGLKPAYSK